MTKSEFVDQVVKASGGGLTKKDTITVLDTAFEVMGRAIGKEKRFTYPGFGTFTVKERSARKGRNPRTGKEIKDQGQPHGQLQALALPQGCPVRPGGRMRRTWDRARLGAWLWFSCRVWIPWLFLKRRWRGGGPA